MELLINLLITATAYLLIPVIFCFSGKQLSQKQIKTIIIVNSACVWLIFTIIRIEAGISGTSFAVFLWSSVAYFLMKKGTYRMKKKVNFKTLVIVILSLMLFASIVLNVSQFIEISKYKKTVGSYNDITIEEHQSSGMTFAEWTEKYYK